MPKKKAKSKAKFTRRHSVIAALVLLVIIAVCFIVLRPDDSATVDVTAPIGTTSRASQIDASELSSESDLDSQADSAQSTNMGSDAALLGAVSGTADEN
jgi:hypothetical protein